MVDQIREMDKEFGVLQSLAIAFAVLTFVCVCARIYVRAGLLKFLGWDDWSMLVAWVHTLHFLQASSCLIRLTRGSSYPTVRSRT